MLGTSYPLGYIAWCEALHALSALALCLAAYLSISLIMTILRRDERFTFPYWLWLLSAFWLGLLSHVIADWNEWGY